MMHQALLSTFKNFTYLILKMSIGHGLYQYANFNNEETEASGGTVTHPSRHN